MSTKKAITLSCIAGFVSISMEIIWFTIVGFVAEGHAGVFGVVLAFILLGIAFGARYIYKRIKTFNHDTSLSLISKAMLLGAAINFIGLPVTAVLMTYSKYFTFLILVNITAISALLGCIFPLLCHITVSDNEADVGKQTSWIYAANIIGATAGPLLTGYVLVDKFPLKMIVAMFCVVPAVVTFLLNIKRTNLLSGKLYVVLSAALVLVAIFGYNFIYTNFFERLRFAEDYTADRKFVHTLENRNGIISVEKFGGHYIFYGGGAYDGAINTNPENEINLISRAYMTAALHPSPKRVLMIGLSSGSWAKVLADFDVIEELVIVEINPGYTEIIKKYPEVASVLNNKKVKIVVDDGRRWLKRNEHEKFDMIVMNTTWHWREHITNIVSAEFLKMCKKVLKANGVMYWNSTWSKAILSTAASQFKYVTTYINFVAGSDVPFSMTAEQKRDAFMKFTRNGQPIFMRNDAAKSQLEKLVNADLSDKRDSIAKISSVIITDNNMATEYKNKDYGTRKGIWSLLPW